MSSKNKNFVGRFINLIPLLILFYLCLSENDTYFKNLNFLSFNLQYIIIYYWVARNPDTLGYGFIFLAGTINDVVIGFPLGITALTYIIISAIAAYVRTVTVRATLTSDWITFVPAVLATNSIYILSILLFTDLSIDYENLLYNSVITIFIYPVIWVFFEFLRTIIRINKNA